MPPSKPENPATLRRGSACLSCRRRKLKCDGLRPVCQQCTKMRRSDECQYDDSKKKSRTQMLREKLAMLEEKVRELESDTSGSNHSHSPYTSSRGSSVLNSAYDEFHQNPYSQLPSLPVDVSSWLDTAPPYASQDGFDAIWPEIGPSSSSNSPSITGSQATGQMSRPSALGNPQSALGHNEGFHQTSSTSNCLSASGWDANQPLPFETHNFLLNAFMAHKNQCYFFSDMSRFANISAVSHQQGPHPALMNAIYLLACHFTKTPLCAQFEEIFLTQTLNEITVALHNANHLVDVIQASTLLAVYYYFNGRVLEGYRHAFSSARLAIGLGLHQVRRVSNTGFNSIDVADAEEKIAAFWQVFLVDRCWSSANGLLSAIPDGKTSSTRITTPLPTVLTSANPEQSSFNSSIFDLFEPQTSLFHAISLAAPAFKAMAAAVYDRSSRLANSLRRDESYWADHHLCQIALQRVQATVWSSANSTELWSVGGPSNLKQDVDMFAVNTMMHASTIYLQADTEFLESSVTTDALTGIVTLASQINASDYPYLDPMIGVCWSGVTNILLQRIKSYRERKTTSFYDEFSSTIPYIKNSLNTLLGYLRPMAEFAPLAGNMEKGIRENYHEYLEYPPPPQYETSMLFSVA